MQMLLAQGGSLEISTPMLMGSIVVLLALMVLNAIFNIGEAALSGLRANRVREIVELKDARAKRMSLLNSSHTSYFAACRVGEHLCRVGIYTVTALASPWLSARITPESTGFGKVLLIGFACVFLVAVINLAFVEAPSSGLAKRNPEIWAVRFAPALAVLKVIVTPAVWIVSALSGLLTRKLGVGSMFATPVVTEEDLREMVEASGASGELIEDEREMIHSIIEFTDTVAREVMTPRTDIDGCDIASSAQEVARMIEETGHTRIPIYQGSIDRIVGIIHAKDLLKTLMTGNGSDIRELMRPALFVPENKDLHGLLQRFRNERSLMAIVQDEFGGTAGLVTMEDLVEEIVGQIVDEYDDEEPEVQTVDEGKWLIDGRMHLDDVNDEIGADFESEEFDTLGGYVFGLCGRQPEEGDEVEDDDWRLRVAATDGRRVLRVMAIRREPVA